MVKSEFEGWKATPEFPFVMISTNGVIRTLDRVVSNGKGTRVINGRILKQFMIKMATYTYSSV